mmetsp:Transcript_26241/g.41084  ORF Transcript_26241/g.41084 Transcript_26241/m.41084 type:complete len:97 (+) Transcript_26241:466-756(+)
MRCKPENSGWLESLMNEGELKSKTAKKTASKGRGAKSLRAQNSRSQTPLSTVRSYDQVNGTNTVNYWRTGKLVNPEHSSSVWDRELFTNYVVPTMD